MVLDRALWSVALYRRDGRLWVRHWWRRFALEPGMTAELTGRHRRRLTILSGGRAVWSCAYLHDPSDWSTMNAFDTTAADPEDFDFGLLVSNLLSDPVWFERCRTGDLS